MKAIILAAGRGSRLGALTDDKPKCMVEVAGRTLLSLQCAALKQGGITQIGVVTGYRSDRFAGSGLELLHNPQWATSNMVVSLMRAASWLRQEPCIISYADIFYLPETVRRIAACKDDLAIAYDPAWRQLWEKRFTDPLADAETFQLGADNWIRTIGARPSTLDEVEGQYMGLLRFTPNGWSDVEAFLATLSPEAVNKLDMTGMLMQLIRQGSRIRAVAINEPWGEVDCASDIALYESMLAKGEIAFPDTIFKT